MEDKRSPIREEKVRQNAVAWSKEAGDTEVDKSKIHSKETELLLQLHQESGNVHCSCIKCEREVDGQVDQRTRE